MKKAMVFILCLIMSLSMVACTKEIVLTKPAFTGIFIGESDPEWSLINSAEAQNLLDSLAFSKWEKADSDKSVKIDFMAIDESERTYSFGQKNDTVLITIVNKSGSEKSTYSVKGTSRTDQIIGALLNAMVLGASVRKSLQDVIFDAGNTGSDFAGINTTFDLTQAESDSLKTVLDINSWTSVKLPETLPETPNAVITISEWKRLIIDLDSGIPYVYYVSQNNETETMMMSKDTYDSFMTLMGNIRTSKLTGPDQTLLDAKISEAYIDFFGVETWKIPNWGVTLTFAEKDQFKTDLHVDQWVKLTKSITSVGTSMVLKTDNDLTLTFAYYYPDLQEIKTNPVVFVTKTSDGSVLGTYYPSGMALGNTDTLLEQWDPPFPPEIKNFTYKVISVGYNDPSEGDVGISYHTFPVSTGQLADLRILMSFSTWELDKDPVKYHFGWLPWLVFNGMGSEKEIYLTKIHDRTVFWVRGIVPGTTNETSEIFYTCDPSVYDALITYANNNFK
jgi:hypothetical protein